MARKSASSKLAEAATLAATTVTAKSTPVVPHGTAIPAHMCASTNESTKMSQTTTTTAASTDASVQILAAATETEQFSVEVRSSYQSLAASAYGEDFKETLIHSAVSIATAMNDSFLLEFKAARKNASYVDVIVCQVVDVLTSSAEKGIDPKTALETVVTDLLSTAMFYAVKASQTQIQTAKNDLYGNPDISYRDIPAYIKSLNSRLSNSVSYAYTVLSKFYETYELKLTYAGLRNIEKKKLFACEVIQSLPPTEAATDTDTVADSGKAKGKNKGKAEPATADTMAAPLAISENDPIRAIARLAEGLTLIQLQDVAEMVQVLIDGKQSSTVVQEEAATVSTTATV